MNTQDVLVVDESLAVQSELRDAFERRGYRVHGVRDEESARRAVARGSFGAAVMGLEWNHIDRRQNRRDLIRDAGNNGPVVMLADGDRLETRVSALREGVTDFIAKPYHPTYVVKRVHESMHAARTPGGPHRILVVDDSITYGHAVATSLARDGHDVVVATSGREADDYLALQKPDAMFLDVFLPDVDGIDFARRIRASPGTRDLPILLLTGRESTHVRARAAEAKVSDFAAKNTSLDDLRLRVQVLLREASGAVRGEPRGAETSVRRVEGLFDRVVSASGLSLVLGRSALTLAMKRAEVDPATLTPATLARAIPHVEQVLATFLTPADAKTRVAALQALSRESDGIR